jgi:hypothetical protein
MARKWKIAIAILAVAVVIGALNFHGLWQRIRRLSQLQSVEEQARREVLTPPIKTPTDVLVKAKIFWAASPGSVAPVEIPLPLSADPVQRSKQVLQALIASTPAPEQRTLPADAQLLGFYILPDGTAIADFSDALASETPSGILSEELTVQSIIQTLENNVPSLRRLKILLHGQEVETLAGHVDLTGFFDLNPPAPIQPATANISNSDVPGAVPATSTGSSLSSATPARPTPIIAPPHPSEPNASAPAAPAATSGTKPGAKQ